MTRTFVRWTQRELGCVLQSETVHHFLAVKPTSQRYLNVLWHRRVWRTWKQNAKEMAHREEEARAAAVLREVEERAEALLRDAEERAAAARQQAEERAAAEEAAHRAHLTRMVLHRLNQRSLVTYMGTFARLMFLHVVLSLDSFASGAWRAYVAECRRRRAVMRRAATRLANSRLGSAA
jgi:hypothetical protein